MTELEVKVDPMLILQCGLGNEYSDASDSETLTENQTFSEKLIEIEHSYNDIKDNSHKQYNCSFCLKRFTSECALQTHMWKHLPKNKQLLFLNFNNPGTWKEKFEDTNCENFISSSNTSSEAEISEHGNMEYMQSEQEGGIRFTCPICGKIISTKGNLKVHLETHRPKGKYGCDICGRM